MPGKRPVLGIFSGGGVKAAAFVGAIREAEQYVDFVGWGGTSAGAIIAALSACGYKPEELQQLLCEAPYSKFFKVSPLRIAFINHYRGAIDPAPLLKWLRKTIGKKFGDRERVSFSDLPAKVPLKIVAANVSTQEIEVYSQTKSSGHEIAQAVLASCSFPLMFPAVKHGNDQLVDGGVFSNFPMWLFDDEREVCYEFTPVLGFSLATDHCVMEGASFLQHVHSVFESVLVAQDRVQEKYMNMPRSANVVRIRIPPTHTLSATANHERLVLCGRDATLEYFRTATMQYGEPLHAPEDAAHQEVMSMIEDGRLKDALSAIVRGHILHGGVARDDGLSAQRVLVRYYIDLMAAVADHGKLEALATILARKISALDDFDRVVGLKKGNILLAHQVARLLKKPLSIFKTDMSYKMGPPFDGPVRKGERILVVDDIASDSSILLAAVRQLNFRRATASCVVTLIERMEGDAWERLRQHNCDLRSVCRVVDDDIDRLIYGHTNLSRDGWDLRVAHD